MSDSPPPLLDTPPESPTATTNKNEKNEKPPTGPSSHGKEEETTGNNNNNNGDDLTKRSSYYFFKSTPAEEFEKYKPKPINPNEIKGNYQAPAPQPVANGASAWNAAGTWEDRDVSKWAQDRLKELIKGLSAPTIDGASARITSVSKCDGDATLLFVRGKKKVGFDLHLTAIWKGEYNSEKTEGTVEIPEISEVNSDEEVAIRINCNTNNNSHDKCKAAMKKLIPKIQEQITKFIEELRAQ